MSTAIVTLLIVAHLAFALVSRSYSPDLSFVWGCLGLCLAAPVLLAGYSVLGPGRVMSRAPVVIVLGCLWFCCLCVGARLHHGWLIYPNFVFLVIVSLGTPLLAMVSCLVVRSLGLVVAPVGGLDDGSVADGSAPHRGFSLKQLMLWVTVAALVCVLVKWSARPYSWQHDWPHATGGLRRWVLGEWSHTVLAALPAVFWAIPLLSHRNVATNLCLSLLAVSFVAVMLFQLGRYWPWGLHFNAIQVDALACAYIGVSGGVILSTAALRLAGFRWVWVNAPDAAAANTPPEASPWRRRGALAAVGCLTFVIAILMWAAVLQVEPWRKTYRRTRARVMMERGPTTVIPAATRPDEDLRRADAGSVRVPHGSHSSSRVAATGAAAATA